MLDTQEQLDRIMAMVKAGQVLHDIGADGRGPEVAGTEIELRFANGFFVLYERSWHEYNGTVDDTYERRHTSGETRMRDILRSGHVLPWLVRIADQRGPK